MPFPLDERYVVGAEAALGVRFPDAYRARMMADNGGELEAADDVWFLHPVRDSSDRKRLARSCYDLVSETTKARSEWRGFPADAVALGSNGSGDFLILLPGDDPRTLSRELRWWDHETMECHFIGRDLGVLL